MKALLYYYSLRKEIGEKIPLSWYHVVKYCKFNSQKLKSTLFNLDCLQFLSHPARLQTMTLLLQVRDLDRACLGFACSNFAKKNKRLLAVYFNFMGSSFNLAIGRTATKSSSCSLLFVPFSTGLSIICVWFGFRKLANLNSLKKAKR